MDYAEIKCRERTQNQKIARRKNSYSFTRTTPITRIFLPKAYVEMFDVEVEVIFKVSSILIKSATIDTINRVKMDKISNSVSVPYNEYFIGKYEIEIIDNGVELFKI